MTSNGAAITVPPSSPASLALASALSTATYRFQCSGVMDRSASRMVYTAAASPPFSLNIV